MQLSFVVNMTYMLYPQLRSSQKWAAAHSDSSPVKVVLVDSSLTNTLVAYLKQASHLRDLRITPEQTQWRRRTPAGHPGNGS